MVFVGAAGVWSMVRAIEEAAFPAAPPVGVSGTLPPLDGTVDVVDANANGPFIPKFRPEVTVGAANEPAASDFQKEIKPDAGGDRSGGVRVPGLGLAGLTPRTETW